MSSVVPPYIPPPPGVNYIANIHACYTFVLISLPLSSVLVPIFLLILFFSTPRSRKTLLFALNIVIVLLGIVEGVLSTTVQSIIMLHPQHPVSNNLFLAYIGIAFYTPIIVDCILILRLSAVYPASITPRTRRIAILVLPFLCTAARIVCVTISVIWPRNTAIISDWSIQLFENFYCSILFLFRLRKHKTFSSRMYRHQSIASRLRAVFYIAISNFIFPSILSIFQLIYVVHDQSVVHGATLLMVNNYVSIIGVVFCTIWSASDVWKSKQLHAYYPEFRQSNITLSGIAPNLNVGPRVASGVPDLDRTSTQSIPDWRPGQDPRDYDSDRKEVDTESGTNLGHTVRGDTSDGYLDALAIHRTLVDADADPSADSHSPVTPHDVQAVIDGKEKDALNWGAALAPPRDCRSSCGGSHTELEASCSFSDSELDLEFNFVTPSPPPSQRHQRSPHSRSFSLSDSLDYRSQEYPQQRDIGETRIAFSPVRDDPSNPPAQDSRRLRASLGSERDIDPFVATDRPSIPRARQPSIMDCSDAEPGGGTPSCDGRSLDDP